MDAFHSCLERMPKLKENDSEGVHCVGNNMSGGSSKGCEIGGEVTHCQFCWSILRSGRSSHEREIPGQYKEMYQRLRKQLVSFD